jgi:uncharacterized protein YyaL (SSP411 family)
MKPAPDGAARAFVCEHFTCRSPAATAGELRALLG